AELSAAKAEEKAEIAKLAGVAHEVVELPEDRVEHRVRVEQLLGIELEAGSVQVEAEPSEEEIVLGTAIADPIEM
ncbi:hypothetical protein C0995_004579, partial [Termitomyces sp. Mi166